MKRARLWIAGRLRLLAERVDPRDGEWECLYEHPVDNTEYVRSWFTVPPEGSQPWDWKMRWTYIRKPI